MIIVTGASGQLGHAIVEALLARGVPANQVGVSVRDPQKATDLAARGVRVRRGDFAEPASLSHAFEGATQVLLVSSNAAAYGGDTLAQHRAAIAAARGGGARRIVYTSHMAAGSASVFAPMAHHTETEAMLAGSGLAWTALRNGFYAASGVTFLGDAPQTGVVEAPADGKVSWTAHADLAEAAAIILTDGEGRFEGPTPPLTGAEALDLADLAALASALLGRPVRRQVLSDEELRAKMAARGAPARAADLTLLFYRASRAGDFAAVDPTLGQLLGRAPTTMRDVVTTRLASDTLAVSDPSSSSTKRVALITGANKGLGYEIAQQLGRDHGMTVLVGARDAARGREATDKLTALGVDARAIALDVTDPASVAAAAGQIEREFGGRLDALINNAGVALDRSPASQTDLEKLQATYATNVFGPLIVTRAMLPLLRAASAGRVVNMSSGLGSLAQNSDPGWEYAAVKPLAYNSSKAALNMQTVLFAAELRDTPVKVNSADPGYCATDLNGHSGPRTVEQGARVAVRLAILPADGPTGGFFDEDGPVPW